MNKTYVMLIVSILLFNFGCKKENQKVPDWNNIKQNANFIVYDNSYSEPYIQPLNVRGWEDGLYITRDGRSLYSYFMPIDVFSLYKARRWRPICFNSRPYVKEPLIGVDMVSNPWGCKNFFQGDIIISIRDTISEPFTQWSSSNMQRAISNEGAPCGVLKDENTFDVFVFTQNRNETEDMEIMFMKDVPRNPDYSTAVPILSSTGVEDNPHIERLPNNSLVILFDRDRFMYYSTSTDNGTTWSEAVKITNYLNDQAPYDVQPHLWNDGADWWVYYCRDNELGKRCIYKSKQQTVNDWNSWGQPELVIEPAGISNSDAIIIGIGEPSLTDNGDLSFVVIYGDLESKDITNVFDCDPWFLPKK